MKVVAVTHYFADDQGEFSPSSMTLDDVSFDVRPGEFVSIVGPSGCGKTTVLNMLAGFISPTHGQTFLHGKEVRGVQSGDVAFMFARDTLFPWRTCLSNVMLPLQVGRKRASRGQARERAVHLLNRVGLAGSENKFPIELSHGMRQRTALARTLACENDIILMDEPFGALDAQTRVLVQDEFAQIWEADRPSVLMVTHDLTEAIALSDRIVVMTHRPARIKAIYEVGIPRPRSVLDLPKLDEFHQLYSKLWDDLRPEVMISNDH